MFHHHYYDVIARVKCSLSRSDGDSNRFITSWWFIPHINHTHPLKWATDHQWHDFGKRHGINWSRSTQGPPDCQDVPWAHSSRPCHTPFSTNMRIHVGPRPNHATSFTVERYFIRPAKYETCVQYDKRDEQRSVLNRHRRNHYSPKPYKTPPGLHLSINTWLFFMITIIANHNQVSTYISQVTGNHLTSIGLSMAKQYFRSWTKIGFQAYLWDKEKVYMQQVFSLNSYNLMQQYIYNIYIYSIAFIK
jgi:hypothetical protein